MPQSNAIAGFVLVGFLIFITARGELPRYIALLFGSSSGGGAGGASPEDTEASPATKAGNVVTKIDQGVKNGLDLQRKLGTPLEMLTKVF